MKLTDKEKEEMLNDSKDEHRKISFRFAKKNNISMTFENYLSTLNKLQKCYNIKLKKQFIKYKNVKI